MAGNRAPFLCIGHRGARGHEPENTLRSVRRAIELGADGIEIDVRFVDGELIVIHDDTLERTTNGHGRVGKKSFAYLRSLDAGGGEKIPTLREVFDLVDRRALINVELKGRDTAGPVQALIDEYVSARGWSHGDFLVSSFLHRELARITDTRIRIGLLFPRVPLRFAKLAKKLGACSIHTPVRSTRRPFVARAHRHGLKVFVYTANSPRSIRRLRAIGVDGVFTDFPERVVSE
jgi:glycerophosphoryl diester phosphodiesterase